jgi:hypothetical protein
MFKKIISLIFIILFSTIIGFSSTLSTNLSLKIMEDTDDSYTYTSSINGNFNLIDDLFDTVSLTEYGYLNGVTSNIQDQFALYYLKTQIDTQGEMETIWGVTLATDSEIPSEDAIEAYIFDADAETITGNWVNTASPWADNEVANDITINLATLASTITITDNEDTAENNAILFTAGGDLDGGNLGIESDGTMYYTPSTGKITATGFVGALTGNSDTVTGFTPASGSLTLAGADALTLTTSAETNVTLPTTGTLIANVVEDTTPELGGELDAGAHSIGFTMQTLTGDGSDDIDWRLGNKMQFTFPAGNETFTFTAPTNPCTLMLTLIQDGGGGRSVTWPGTVKWPGGIAPTLSTAAGARDKIALDWDGTQYDGVVSLDFK